MVGGRPVSPAEVRSSDADLHSRPPRHLAPLFDNPKLDKELRAMLREKFPEFCSSPSPPVEGMGPPILSPAGEEGWRYHVRRPGAVLPL